VGRVEPPTSRAGTPGEVELESSGRRTDESFFSGLRSGLASAFFRGGMC
jgi:hypothetical protein